MLYGSYVVNEMTNQNITVQACLVHILLLTEGFQEVSLVGVDVSHPLCV